MIASTTNYNVKEQEPAADGIQLHGMERFSAMVMCEIKSPVDQGSSPPDSVGTEGHTSESSGNRQKGSLQGMKQELIPYIKTNKGLISNRTECKMYFIFLFVVIIGIFGSTSNMAFWCREHLDDLFVNTKFQDGIKERTFKNLSTITQFWKFAETVMIDSMYQNFQDDTHQAFGCMLQDIKLVGALRLRQVKGRNGSCIVREAFQRSYRACHDLYSPAKEDKEPFGPGIGTAWTYSTAEELRGSSYRGRFSTYSGGGYYEDLSLNRSETIEKLLTLRNNQWITRGTCAIFLDLTLYSANISTVFIVKLVFENTPRGILTSYDCKIVKLHQLVTSYDYFVAVCELMFVAFIFLFTAKKRVDVMVFKRKCMESVWDGFGLAILMLGYPIICFRIYSYVVIEPQIIQNISEEKFSNFDSYNWYEEYYNFGVVCLFTCAWPMIFKYAGVREFASLLCRYSMEMFTVLFIFFIIIATYIRMICVL